MRNSQRRLHFAACIVLSMVAAPGSATTELCGPGWVEATAAKLAVTDGAGHGPDLGSEEWMNALTTRLGGHQQPGTQAWCDWVNQHLQLNNNGPAFDCKQAGTNNAEALICQTPRLSQLDQELAKVFAKASALAVNEHPPLLKVEQRGWLKGRNECWKEADQIACMQAAYQRRIAELQARYRLVSMRGPLRFHCGAAAADELVLSYFATEPATLIAERGDSVSLMFLQQNGRHYVGRNETLWPQQDGVRLQWGYDAPVFSCRQSQ